MAFDRLKLFVRAWSDLKRFRSLSINDRKIVFYSEDVHSMVHFEGIIRKLASDYNEHVCYLTSDPNDPVLEAPFSGMRPFYIGEGLVRTIAFSTMRADVLIMTMPDLQNYHIKRSQVYPTHYLYLFHAMVSTHSNYRKGAFDHFDTVFCTGPFQVDEIRATEQAYNLKPKRLYEDGYRRLESIIEDVKAHVRRDGGPSEKGPKKVILAPSWGENAILETCGTEIIERLLQAGYQTIVRPHPMTSKHKPQLIARLREAFSGNELFALQTDVRDKKTLYESHVLISDWSGVAMEYAFACERPVVFIDVPKKCNNPEADRIPHVPVEVTIREQIGKVVSPTHLEQLPAVIEDFCTHREAYRERICRARSSCVFNLGDSLDGAVAEIVDIAREVSSKNRQASGVSAVR